MDMLPVLYAVLAGYLIGSISFARIVTRLATGEDVTQFEVPVAGTEDKYKVIAIGGNSVSSRLGKRYGFLTSILDMLKVILVVVAFKLLYPGQPYHLVAALAGMAGHIWPVYYRFNGGAGWSAAFGSLLAVDWLGALLTPVISFIFGMFIVRDITTAIISWMWFVIPWLWLRTGDLWHVGYAVGMNILFVLAMIPEIKVMLKYKREGKLMNYGAGSLGSNPMGRGFLKMARALGVKTPDQQI